MRVLPAIRKQRTFSGRLPAGQHSIVKSWREGANYGKGVRTSDLQRIASEAYKETGDADVNGLQLVRSTKTLKFYRKPGTDEYIVGVRGTHDGRDVVADAALATGFLRHSSRYKEDRAAMDKFLKEHPSAQVSTASHSLGGAISRQLEREFKGRISGGASFNSAIALNELVDPAKLRSSRAQRLTTKRDPLFRLAKPFLRESDRPLVVQEGPANPLAAHKLSSFDATSAGV
jgi:hypothetical protein